jgi:nucleoside-diphosphate-sugar epimerase
MDNHEGLTLVTGGAGYVGSATVRELLRSGRLVRVLDSLLHGQRQVAEELAADGAEIIEGDVRDAEARRRALDGVTSIVHLAAIVGDPACAREPEVSEDVNVDATRALLADARESGVQRFVFASTCSNYGRMDDPSVPITEEGELRPVSRYAEQKVTMERSVLNGEGGGMTATCLRFATVYGMSDRMRFDLTVNEFTRDLWDNRELEVFGERFWRPYIHVRDAARAIRTVLDSDPELVAGEVFNAGHSDENYRKLDLVEVIREHTPSGSVTYVRRDEDPRDYKVSFEKIHSTLGYDTSMTVPEGVAEVITALSAGRFADPYDRGYRNVD